MARLISLIANHEKAIYASTGTRRRERNQWAKQIKSYGNKDAAKTRCERDRYAEHPEVVMAYPHPEKQTLRKASGRNRCGKERSGPDAIASRKGNHETAPGIPEAVVV
ncbi:hypothetical protein [Roseiconus lacunae]|uniref:hypothetical protein n=1 Tax=Roseiconus lacunae TaxID=2605694 RepID=UPI0011F31E93|nr:hypothetical protein [Roseiconus lacunae]